MELWKWRTISFQLFERNKGVLVVNDYEIWRIYKSIGKKTNLDLEAAFRTVTDSPSLTTTYDNLPMSLGEKTVVWDEEQDRNSPYAKPECGPLNPLARGLRFQEIWKSATTCSWTLPQWLWFFWFERKLKKKVSFSSKSFTKTNHTYAGQQQFFSLTPLVAAVFFMYQDHTKKEVGDQSKVKTQIASKMSKATFLNNENH